MMEAQNKGKKDHILPTDLMWTLALFQHHELVTSNQIVALFEFKHRTNTPLRKKWVEVGFLEILNSTMQGVIASMIHYIWIGTRY